ncbi:response regulator transcription factor [Halomonas cerina]|uniref:Two-component system KDP operon response regulator KdpE n=1 Tax=Halomonas cerina TaxID=447424 RepID=A0A839VAN6_9GAMM|nr:response regulator transcription factor [Halomonas cerina]MBB3191035.1 two-component system KDP operon response regulator KdpE [Halomonas cerina]
MPVERSRILVIDDEPQIRRFLRISLSSQGFEVIEAAAGAESIPMIQAGGIDLVLLDLGLPDMDGQTVLEVLRRHSDVPVIVVSVREQENEKVQALDNGANDYVTKPFGIRELLARIRALLRRQSLATSSEAIPPYRHGGLCIDLQARRVRLNDMPVHLTPKEYAVLERLVRQAGRVVTQTQLLREIWGPVHAHDSHYLRIVISKLRHKLGDDPQSPTLLQTEAGIGYRLLTEP